jgi:fructoselysine transporter
MAHLNRRINLLQATAINMIDMVGIGPFVVIPLVIQYFNSSLFLWAWIFGALVAFVDGMIWSELGAAYPLAGGSYQFLNKAYNGRRGRMMSFLFVWQTSIQAPLVVASGAIGFSQYMQYLLPLNGYEQKLVSALVIILLTFLLYRKIETIGKISVFLWIGVIITMTWIIIGGFTHKQYSLNIWPDDTNDFFKAAFWMALGQGSVKTIYTYLGYYNVCHLGGEIINPQKNIPKSIFISIACIALLYLCMNISIAQVIPPQEATGYKFIVSVFVEKVYGLNAARVATALMLWIAFASLFAVLLGYSRVPYAAALDGNFFRIFGRLHPTKNFPHISLLFIAALGLLFSLSFSLKDVISAILAMRILIQFIAQAIGVMLLRERKSKAQLPFKMALYPLPVFVSIIFWLFVFFSTGRFALWGSILIICGWIVYQLKTRMEKRQVF